MCACVRDATRPFGTHDCRSEVNDCQQVLMGAGIAVPLLFLLRLSAVVSW